MIGLGLLALAAFVAHTAACIALARPEDSLWACHVASALLGVGLLTGGGKVNACAAIGGVWITVGTPLWLLDLARGAEFVPISLITHAIGFTVALLAFRRGGVPRGTWWRALLALAALQLLSRFCTPPAANVNGAFRSYDAFAAIVPGHAAYLVGASLVTALLFWTSERVLTRATRARQA